MRHILMIESWIDGNGRILPERLKKQGYEYTFVTRKLEHYKSNLDNGLTHPVISNAKNVLVLDTNNTEKLIESLKLYHEKNPFDGVISVCDYYLETVYEVASALNLPQPGSSAVSTERQKHLVREITRKDELACPNFVAADNLDKCIEGAEKIGYPLIIKPSDLGSSAFVKLINNEKELIENAKNILDNRANFREQIRNPIVLLEEIIIGEEFSVESVTYNGSTTFLGITDKSLTGAPYFIEDGHMFPAKLTEKNEREIISYVADVLNSVGHDNGIAHTEVKLTNKGPVLIEINPRPAGGYIADLVNLITGVDILNVLISLSVGKSPDLEFKDTGFKSSAIKFNVPSNSGKLLSIQGIKEVEKQHDCYRIKFTEAKNQTINEPIDNACYLGHIIATDEKGTGARLAVEKFMEMIEVKICKE